MGKVSRFRFYRMCCSIRRLCSRREAGDGSARWGFRAPAGLGAFRLRRSPARVFFNAGVDGTFRLRAPARRPGTPRLLQSTSGSRFFRRVSCAGGPCLLCFVQIPMPPSVAAACGIRRLGSRRDAGHGSARWEDLVAAEGLFAKNFEKFKNIFQKRLYKCESTRYNNNSNHY